ncbi:hypothetical protein [Alkalihalobacillus trypoxylicola]|uniref:Uncharacterized protein n=1 Tax=Alkalihalobacillus trypoxylicola TaxID=519424 RepID=A0A162F6H5_9BACI|nr:hypothetical protein [Alkalihalobacillus trypoxylicola]KYG34895.1 hypothetical protein AZF04_00755 [Alkalihalobacillus trypoxylicola]
MKFEVLVETTVLSVVEVEAVNEDVAKKIALNDFNDVTTDVNTVKLTSWNGKVSELNAADWEISVKEVIEKGYR